jgi:hypothetical protein
MKLSDIEDADKLVTKEWLDSRLEALRYQLSAEFRKELIGVIIWIGSLLMGMATIILGGMYFLLTHVKTP